jgi:hypothetical protein
MLSTNQTNRLMLVLIAAVLLAPNIHAASVIPTVFATGTAISSTSPDSVVFGDGSLWISYQNNADSAGASGSSTVARYSHGNFFSGELQGFQHSEESWNLFVRSDASFA